MLKTANCGNIRFESSIEGLKTTFLIRITNKHHLRTDWRQDKWHREENNVPLFQIRGFDRYYTHIFPNDWRQWKFYYMTRSYGVKHLHKTRHLRYIRKFFLSKNLMYIQFEECVEWLNSQKAFGRSSILLYICFLHVCYSRFLFLFFSEIVRNLSFPSSVYTTLASTYDGKTRSFQEEEGKL